MKRNIKNDFESVYLRFNTVKRDIAKADPEILKDEEFRKTVKFAAGKSFATNHGLYESNGFSFEDILSITTLFGLAFMGNTVGQEFKTSRDKYNIMIYYINQRLNKMCEWIVKKFNVDDAVVHSMDGAKDKVTASFERDSYVDAADLFSMNRNNLDIKLDGIPMWGIEESESTSERIETCEELLKNTRRSMKESGKQTIKTRDMERQLVKELSDLRIKKREESFDDKSLTKELKKKLTEDPQKYSDILSYYATTKHVSKDVRRIARLYCKRYDIDYISWVRKKLDSSDCDRTEFTF